MPEMRRCLLKIWFRCRVAFYTCRLTSREYIRAFHYALQIHVNASRSSDLVDFDPALDSHGVIELAQL